MRIERSGGDVALKFDREGGTRWLALAACMACWAYEEQCNGRAPSEDDPVRFAMYRECLVNQAASIAVRQDNDKPIPNDEQVLLKAIEDGYIEAIIFWEIIADAAPLIVYLLPQEVQKSILRYIDTYDFVTNQVI